MNKDEFDGLPVAELLRMTQTNVTPDASKAFEVAQIAYGRAETPVDLGTAARQAAFRAEQAGVAPDIVDAWFEKSCDALVSDDPAVQRELIATELLVGRTMALRIEKLGSKAVGQLFTTASTAFARGEAILQEQHVRGELWDNFGTMLARHRATFEAMNGNAGFGAMTAARGLWRALRTEKAGMAPKEHRTFVVKQLGMNAAAGALALSKPFSRVPAVSSARHQLALKLLG